MPDVEEESEEVQVAILAEVVEKREEIEKLKRQLAVEQNKNKSCKEQAPLGKKSDKEFIKNNIIKRQKSNYIFII